MSAVTTCVAVANTGVVQVRHQPGLGCLTRRAEVPVERVAEQVERNERDFRPCLEDHNG